MSTAGVSVSQGVTAGQLTATWATIAALTPANGTQARVTDIGANGSLWNYNATDTRWRPLNGSVTLLSTAIPMILPSSGSIGNNGALTGITALPIAYPSCYMYFPANAISAGSVAGMYYVVMSSTTAGTIYNNVYTSGTPTIPASPTPFVTIGPGAYTQTTGADIALLSYTLPGKAMGLSGQIISRYSFGYSNSAGTKTIRIKFGMSSYMNNTPTTTANLQGEATIANQGVANSQVLLINPAYGSNTGVANGYVSTDTASDVAIVGVGQLAVATDYVVIDRMSHQLVTP